MKIFNFKQTIEEASLLAQAEITDDQAYAIGLSLSGKRAILISDNFKMLCVPMVVITKKSAMIATKNLQELFDKILEAFKLSEKNNICVSICAQDDNTLDSVNCEAPALKPRIKNLANIDITKFNASEKQITSTTKKKVS